MSFEDMHDVGRDTEQGNGYKVYPEKLRQAADDIGQVAHLARTFADVELANTYLGPMDLGLPGTATVLMPGLNGLGTVERYNQAIQRIIEITRANAAELETLTGALQKAAVYYEQLDQDAYERMKKLEGGMN